MRAYSPIRWLLLIIAVLLFLLAAFSVAAPINLVDLGLAFFAGASLVP
jgi:hypothetical protein